MNFYSSRHQEFKLYLKYVRELDFETTPDYDYLRGLFTQAIEENGMVEDGVYDWDELNGGRGWQASKYSHHRDHHHHHVSRAHNPQSPPHRGAVTQDRLNAPQPATPGTKPTAPRNSLPQLPQNQYGVSGKPPRPVNGAMSPSNDEPHVVGSMQAQYPYTSNANLSTAARPSMNVSNSGPLQTNPDAGRVTHGTHNEQNDHHNQEESPNLARRIIKAFCCG